MKAVPFATFAFACVAVLSAALTSELKSQSADSASPVAPVRPVT